MTGPRLMGLGANLPALPVVVPLLTAAVLAGLRRWLSRAAADAIGIAAAAANLCVCLSLLRMTERETIVYWFGNWHPRGAMVLGITFAIDPVAAGLATLASLLTLLAMVFSWKHVDAGANHFQPLMMIFLAGMCGFCLTGDLFNLFVFFELMSTAAFALCGLKTQEPAPLQGAFNFAVTNTIAAFLALTGIAMLYAVTGALNMAQIGLQIAGRHDPLVLFCWTLLVCGFLVKAAVVPFQFWLADAHSVAPTPVCVLFSGLMVELGLYAVLRLHAVVFQAALAPHAARLRVILLFVGMLTVVVGGVMCYAEHYLKRMLAFSTICHSGLMLCAIAVQGGVAIAGFVAYMVAHAMVKAGLFFCSGMLLHRLRTMSEPKLFGRGKPLKWTAVLWFLGALGLAGAPVFATVWGEALTSQAGEKVGVAWISWVFLLGGALTGAAVLRAGMRIFLGWGDGTITDEVADVDELPETEGMDTRIRAFHWMPAAVCVLGAVALTFIPGWVTHAHAAAERLWDGAGYARTVYGHGSLPGTVPYAVEVTSAAVRGGIASLLALLLALSSVFRLRLPRWMRLGAVLEGPMRPFRELQSGHPGDYVMWLTVGVAGLGCAFVFLLR